MDIATIVLGGIVALLLLLTWHLTKNRGQLDGLGIPIDKQVGLLGSGPIDLHNHVLHKVQLDKFRELGTKTYGRYDGIVPTIVTMDPEVLKSVLVKNFESFTDILVDIDDKHTTLDISGGERWRELRKNLSPTFTSGKLKGMLEPMADVADATLEHIDEVLTNSKNGEIEMKQVWQALGINTIARCAFGIEANAHKNPEQDLVKYGCKVFEDFRSTNWLSTFFAHLINYLPELLDKIPLWPAAFDKIWDITDDIMKQRREKDIRQNDFIDRLLELQRLKSEDPDALKYVTNDMIIAQGVIFFVAGYETTANTLSTLCYNLAKHPQIQERLYNEIQEVLEQHNGHLDHNTINDMTYLDAVINENLRLNGPVTMHIRQCVKDAEVIPGLTIKKGWRVQLPIYCCHHNEEFFPEPEEFRPERFLKENADNIIPYTFRPFGGGPRLCIGQRFAQVEIKLAMAKLLAKYRLLPTENTKLEHLKGDLFLVAFKQMMVKLEKRIV